MIALFAFAPAGAGSPPVGGQTLAILPFKPLLPAERNESLELGMTESLIASLGQHSRQVISPLSSVRRYAALDQDAIAAGRELGVDTVLDGSVQRRGERLRVAVRLLRVADGRQLWAQSFDQEFTTIFEVQDVIASRVAQALAVRWVGSASTRGAPYTQDPEAYALYASGRFAWTRQSEQSLLQAIGFFEQAIARDPNYALAYAGLADSHAVLGVFGIRAPHEVFPKARSAVDKALSIDPDLAAHIRRWVTSRCSTSTIGRALPCDPRTRSGSILDCADDFTDADCCTQCGPDRSALAASERAQQLEPLWLAARAAAASTSTMRDATTSRSGFSGRCSHCDCPNDASAALMAKTLKAQGFKRVRPLAGGLDAWRAQGLPIDQGSM